MATVDLSIIQTYLPILVFLLVFTVLFAVLAKTKILGENKYVNLFISFIVATIFVGLTSAREYVLSVTPWFVVFVIVAFLIFVLTGFVGNVPEGLKKGIGTGLVVALLVLFLVSAYYSFSSVPFIDRISDWAFKPRVYGALLVVVLSALVSWVLIKAK